MQPPALPLIRAVVFDLDGLMFNTEDIFNEVGHEVCRRRGKEMTRDLLQQMMGRRAEAIAVMIEYHQWTDTVEGLIDETRTMFFELVPNRLAPMPGLFELLARIEERQLPKAVATSSHRGYLEEMLNRFELLDRFDLTLAAEDVSHGKPDPEIYLTAAERLGIAPGEMLVLEDSHAGSLAAARAGAVIIGVPNDHSRYQDFSHTRAVANRLDDPCILQLL